jgi:hypothetical protein
MNIQVVHWKDLVVDRSFSNVLVDRIEGIKHISIFKDDIEYAISKGFSGHSTNNIRVRLPEKLCPNIGKVKFVIDWSGLEKVLVMI